MSTTLDIKNLSIALEVLSRFPSREFQREEISALLDHAIAMQKEDCRKEYERRHPLQYRDPNEIPF